LLLLWKKKKKKKKKNVEISIPGFLLMTEFHKIRIEESLGKGGSGLVFKGTFLDPVLIQQHSTRQVALKKVQGLVFFFSFFFLSFFFLFIVFLIFFLDMDTLSPEDNLDLFFQELSMMWFAFFFIFKICILFFIYFLKKLLESK